MSSLDITKQGTLSLVSVCSGTKVPLEAPPKDRRPQIPPIGNICRNGDAIKCTTFKIAIYTLSL